MSSFSCGVQKLGRYEDELTDSGENESNVVNNYFLSVFTQG